MRVDWEQQYRETYEDLVRFLHRKVWDADRAHDLVQETFVRALDHDPEDPRAFLFTIAANFVGFDRSVLRLAANEAVPQNLPPGLAETIPQLPVIREGKSAAVVCSGFSCQPPISDPDQFRRMFERTPKA